MSSPYTTIFIPTISYSEDGCVRYVEILFLKWAVGIKYEARR